MLLASLRFVLSASFGRAPLQFFPLAFVGECVFFFDSKNKHPKVLNDYRPVLLTSLVMKYFERLIKKEFLPHSEPLLDPLQFAYRAGRGVEDATATLLNLVLKHLEGSKTHA